MFSPYQNESVLNSLLKKVENDPGMSDLDIKNLRQLNTQSNSILSEKFYKIYGKLTINLSATHQSDIIINPHKMTAGNPQGSLHRPDTQMIRKMKIISDYQYTENFTIMPTVNVQLESVLLAELVKYAPSITDLILEKQQIEYFLKHQGVIKKFNSLKHILFKRLKTHPSSQPLAFIQKLSNPEKVEKIHLFNCAPFSDAIKFFDFCPNLKKIYYLRNNQAIYIDPELANAFITKDPRIVVKLSTNGFDFGVFNSTEHHKFLFREILKLIDPENNRGGRFLHLVLTDRNEDAYLHLCLQHNWPNLEDATVSTITENGYFSSMRYVTGFFQEI